MPIRRLLHSSFKNEELRQLFEALRRMFHERGYQRRDLAWYSYTQELARTVHMSPRHMRDKMWFFLGVAPRALLSQSTNSGDARRQATHPGIEDCAISVGLHTLVPDPFFEKVCDFSDRSASHAVAIPKIVKTVSNVGCASLEQFLTLEDVRAFVHSDRSRAWTIREPDKLILTVQEEHPLTRALFKPETARKPQPTSGETPDPG
jgi:hypothetical protein